MKRKFKVEFEMDFASNWDKETIDTAKEYIYCMFRDWQYKSIQRELKSSNLKLKDITNDIKQPSNS